jgi:hypothetical protein
MGTIWELPWVAGVPAKITFWIPGGKDKNPCNLYLHFGFLFEQGGRCYTADGLIGLIWNAEVDRV